MLRPSFVAAILLLLGGSPLSVLAQDTAATTTAAATGAVAPDTSGQVDPSATCPYQVGDQIQACRATVYADEAALPGGPCVSTDWACICNVQQGLVACYDPCPGVLPSTDLEYNRAQCAGQNGYTNKAANEASGIDYMGSPLTTTLPAGFSQGSTTLAAATSTAASAATTTTGLATSSIATTAAASTTARPAGSSGAASPSSASSPSSAASTSGSVFNGSATKGASSSSGVSAGLLLGFMGVLALAAL